MTTSVRWDDDAVYRPPLKTGKRQCCGTREAMTDVTVEGAMGMLLRAYKVTVPCSVAKVADALPKGAERSSETYHRRARDDSSRSDANQPLSYLLCIKLLSLIIHLRFVRRMGASVTQNIIPLLRLHIPIVREAPLLFSSLLT